MSVSIRHDPFPVKDPYHGIYAHGVECHDVVRIWPRLSGVAR
jgi:hypothetical protein